MNKKLNPKFRQKDFRKQFWLAMRELRKRVDEDE